MKTIKNCVRLNDNISQHSTPKTMQFNTLIPKDRTQIQVTILQIGLQFTYQTNPFNNLVSARKSRKSGLTCKNKGARNQIARNKIETTTMDYNLSGKHNSPIQCCLKMTFN